MWYDTIFTQIFYLLIYWKIYAHIVENINLCIDFLVLPTHQYYWGIYQ